MRLRLHAGARRIDVQGRKLLVADLSGGEELLAYDALEQSFRTFRVRRDPACPACGENAGEIVIAEYDEYCMPHPKVASAAS